MPTPPDPLYCELGVLLDDGEKAQCHACGEWYLHLGVHTNAAVTNVGSAPAESVEVLVFTGGATGHAGLQLDVSEAPAVLAPNQSMMLAEQMRGQFEWLEPGDEIELFAFTIVGGHGYEQSAFVSCA